MKKSGLLLICAILFTFLSYGHASAQQAEDVSQKVVKAIGDGNARETAKYFGASIDLKVPGNEGTFSKNQAELILRNFFSGNSPDSFSVQHKGRSRDGSPYVIGTYRSTNGTSFRTYFLMKNISGNMMIHLLQFDLQ